MLFNTLLAAFFIAQSGYFEPWGKDADLKPAAIVISKKEPSWAVQLSDAIIRFHQEVISPVDGPRSHYRPSSSQYMQQAMHRYGFVRGFIMGCDRLLRENDEEWVYRTTYYEGKPYKYDPPKEDKYE